MSSVLNMHGFDPRHPFTLEQARRFGISANHVRRNGFRRIYHGVYIDADIPDSLVVRSRAALLVAPEGGVLSHYTAARLWCSRAMGSAQVHLAYSSDPRVHRDEVRVHRFTYPLDTAHRHGLRVTSPGMTFMHQAVHLELVELVAFGDQLVKRSVTTAEELQSYARGWEHQGKRAGAQAASLVRPGVDSRPESHLRLLIVFGGLPEPTVNHVLGRPDGSVRNRFELAYEEIKLAIEYDGRWHDEPAQRVLDEARRTALAREGWTFFVVKAGGLYETAEVTLLTLVGQMRELGMQTPDPDFSGVHRYLTSLFVS